MTDGDQTISPTSTTTDPEPENTVVPPLSTDLNGAKNNDNTYAGTVTVTLTPTNPSEIASIEYSTDNGQTVKTYTDPLTFSDPGTYTIQIVETDKFGNQSDPQTITFTIISPITQVINNSSNLGIGGGSTTNTPTTSNIESLLNPLTPYFSDITPNKTSNTQNAPENQITSKLENLKPEFVLPQKTNSMKTLFVLLLIILAPLTLSLFATFLPHFPFSKKP